jgi:Zn-dependent peptidase ImmA (M78 family)
MNSSGSHQPDGTYARYHRRVRSRIEEAANPRRAYEAAALRVIRSKAIAAGLSAPARLEEIVAASGIADFRYLPLPVRGRLVKSPQGLVMEINEGLSETDRALTVAHEVCHLFLEGDQPSGHLSARERQPAAPEYARVEDICDLGARELVLPEDWLIDYLRHKEVSLGLASDLARRLGLSIEFVARRAIEVGAWHGRLIWWQVSPTAGGITAIETFPSQNTRYVSMIAPTPPSSLLGESLTLGGIRAGKLRLAIGEEAIDYQAECMALDSQKILSILVFTP